MFWVLKHLNFSNRVAEHIDATSDGALVFPEITMAYPQNKGP